MALKSIIYTMQIGVNLIIKGDCFQIHKLTMDHDAFIEYTHRVEMHNHVDSDCGIIERHL